MKQKIHFQKKTVIGLFLLLWAIVGLGCGGAGGGGGDTSASKKVTITGSVQIDTGSAAFQEATCRFVDGQGVEYARADANMLGEYTLAVPPDVEGYVACTPAAFSNLALTTYCSTKGLAAGATLEGEAVTIHSTVAAQIVAGEEPDDPTARKEELLTTMAKGQDPDLNLVTEVAAALYNALLRSNLDLNFTGLTIGDDQTEGIGGTVGSGVDGELISDARCEFVAGDVLSADQPVLTNAALADFCRDGQLNRSDLQDIAPSVNGDYSYRQEEIRAAFERVFPEGIGQPYAGTANKAGAYSLAAPANVPGYVRCTPPDQDQLVLATYVPGRQEGESLEGQDVTPATTVHALQIASKLAPLADYYYSDCDSCGDVDAQRVKDNFINDISGMKVCMLKENGAVSGFQLRPDTAPTESQVGLVAFCATALYNILYHNPSNVDYLTALDNFFRTQVVEPTFLMDQGMTAEEARAAAAMLGAAVIQAQETLDTELGLALSTARINITLLDTPDGQPVPGVTVFTEESNYYPCYGCYTQTDAQTDAQGQLSGVIINLSSEPEWMEFYTTEGDANLVCFYVVPMATLNITMMLRSHSHVEINNNSLEDRIRYDGSGQVTSADDRVDCHVVQGDGAGEYRAEYDEFSGIWYDSCRPYYPPGTTVTLTAIPTAYSTFVGWEGDDCSGTAPTCTLTAGYDQTVKALFAPICEAWPYEVWPRKITFPAYGGDEDAYYFINNDFPESCGELTVSTSSNWITISDEDYGGQGRNLNVEANPNPGPRTSMIMIGEQAITVAQDGQQCTLQDYFFSPAPSTFESTGGTGSLQVRAPDHCPWQPIVDADWITITSESAEQRGNGTVNYTVAENTGAASREGIISVAGTQIMVEQNNIAANPLRSLTIQGAGEGAGEVNVIRQRHDDVYDFGCHLNNGWFSGQCATIYQPGTKVELQAETADNSGWIFSNWTGSCSGQLPWCDVTMDHAQTVGARFVPSHQAELRLSMTPVYFGTVYEKPAELVMGTSPSYSFSVFNAGVADAQSFSVGFYISSDAVITTDDVLIGNSRVHVDGLASRTGIEVSVPYAAWIPTDLAVGPAFFGVIIDESNSVEEDIETNNTYAFPVNIVSGRQTPSKQRQDTKKHYPSHKKTKTQQEIEK